MLLAVGNISQGIVLTLGLEVAAYIAYRLLKNRIGL